jgi:hypothetical protein
MLDRPIWDAAACPAAVTPSPPAGRPRPSGPREHISGLHRLARLHKHKHTRFIRRIRKKGGSDLRGVAREGKIKTRILRISALTWNGMVSCSRILLGWLVTPAGLLRCTARMPRIILYKGKDDLLSPVSNVI